MTDLIRREDAVKACKELCIDGPTDALDTGRNLGVGECINAIRSLPAFEPDVEKAAAEVYGYDGHYSHDALTKARAILHAAGVLPEEIE